MSRKFRTPAEVEDFMKGKFNEYHRNCHPEDAMTFVEFIENCSWYLNDTGWKWDDEYYRFVPDKS